MNIVEQIDMFDYLQEIEAEEKASTELHLAAPAPLPSNPVRLRFYFLKWPRRTALSCCWTILHNLFGLACWVNIYSVTRGFGGRQEGGWYYLQHRCLKSRQVGFWEAQALRMKWLQEYGSLRWGDLMSKSGGQEIVVLIESRKAASCTTSPPQFVDYADRAIPHSLIKKS